MIKDLSVTNKSVQDELQDLLQECARYHEEGRHRLSLNCYQKAMTLVAPSGDATIMAYLLSAVGMEYRDCDDYHHAAELLITALTILPAREETLELKASIKKKLAITFEDIYGPQKPEVMQLLEESCNDYRQQKNLGQEANVLQHIGGSLVQLNRLKEAERVLTEALEKARAAGDIQLEGWIYDDLADMEVERNDWGMALEYTRRARDKARSVGDLEAEGDTWVNEARVQMRMEHPEDALEHAGHALALYTEAKNQRRTIRARRHIAKAYVKLGKLDDAFTTLRKAMRTAAGLDLWRDQAMLHLDLGNVELQRRNLGLAHQYAIDARALAEREGMDDLVNDADELLRKCR